ncbi:hypothetical protein Nepgr_017780 [Nepenthes gracilis]|uniref:Uncharacterized protein n=1 Tax=Nepenthes gracilis TaxID=150966 RepID=A0AAD3SSA6_NEPGR|nr:hypothetical protein Nepgr_017780 [Nepenthes gracilis]
MAAKSYGYTEEDMLVDDRLGYPRAYAKLCRDRSLSPYSHGPPFAFDPYSLHPREVLRAKELDEMFPVINPQAKPTTNPRTFVSLLWKQLNHLGNAGFDPAVFRVDPYGNVLYYHADSASPLAWDIDHWFPCTRGGLTVPRNLRMLQWQVCKRKHKKLEILVPWWDLQVGISINQFLSVFAASNSDFRHRAFSWLFSEGENEELNDSQTVDSHNFPQHFMESKEELGLAPAAIVLISKNKSSSYGSTLQSIDINKQPKLIAPIIAATKSKYGVLKENENPDMEINPYKAIVMARDSLKQREETNNMKAEIHKLDDEVNDWKQKNEEEKVTIKDLERVLTKRRQRAEKCRKLAEAQSSYRSMLEKMIRDAMHQSVVYKEQVRLNQAASSALMAALEAQRAICDSAEKELHKKNKHRDDLEKLMARKKRSRMNDTLCKEIDLKTMPTSSVLKPRTPHKELRVFLEEEQKLSEAGRHSLDEEIEQQQAQPAKEIRDELADNHYIVRFPLVQEPEIEEDPESRKERGKENVEKWLQMLLENSLGDEITPEKYPQKEIKAVNQENTQQRNYEKDYGDKGITQIEASKRRSVSTPRRRISETSELIEAASNGKRVEMRKSFGGQERTGKGVEEDFSRSDSARAFRRIPSSPSIILSMRKGVDCMMKKPMVIDDDDGDKDHHVVDNKLFKSSFKLIKKAVKK